MYSYRDIIKILEKEASRTLIDKIMVLEEESYIYALKKHIDS